MRIPDDISGLKAVDDVPKINAVDDVPVKQGTKIGGDVNTGTNLHSVDMPDGAPVNRNGVNIEGGTGAEDIIQYEKMKSQYAANEIINADRVGSGLKSDPYHRAACFIPEEQLAQGRTFTFTNGDGRKMTMLQTEGEYNGVAGIFEYILNPQGQWNINCLSWELE